jgi:hypothetical protein
MVAVHRDNEPLNPHPWLVPSRRVGTSLSLLSTPIYRRLKGGEMPGIKMRRSVELKRAEL